MEGYTTDFFKGEMKSVGYLPGVPVYLYYQVPATLRKPKVMMVPASELPAYPIRSIAGRRTVRGARYSVEFGVDNYLQVLPEPETDPDFEAESAAETRARLRKWAKPGTFYLGDCYQISEAFDKVSSPQLMVEFLKSAGPFLTTEGTLYFTWEDFRAWQQYFVRWRVRGKAAIRELPTVELKDRDILYGLPRWDLHGKDPFGRDIQTAYLTCSTVVGAIAATILNDQMQKVKWMQCQYEHCPKALRIFRAERNVRDHKYCDRGCKGKAKQQRKHRAKKEAADEQA